MANVYLALMSGPARFQKLLVLKVLREDIDANRDELAAMFLDEARLAARLQHRNIVQTNEFGEIDGQYYIAMEYLEGHTLRALQRKIGPLPLAEELRILAETARGLHYAHELLGLDGERLSVVHRDVSPQNVFVTYDGQVKLLDFGIAKVQGAEHLTQVGVIKGKIDYIAPEQVRGDEIDRRADVFSLGAMLWEAITGARFGGGAKVPEVTKFHKRLTGGEPKVRELKPDVPSALAAIVDEAIALDPSDRLPSAGAFADRIEAYLATLPNPPSERSLSALVTTAFQEEREKLRKTIEEQCKNLPEVTPGGGSRNPLDLRLVAAAGLDLSAPGTGSTAGDGTRGSLVRAGSGRWRLAVILGGMVIALTAALLFVLVAMPRGAREDAAARASPTSAPEAAHASREPEPAQPTKASEPEAARSPPPSDPSSQASVPVRSNPTERSFKLVVDATPPNAQVALDGVPLPSLPFTGRFPRSTALHRLEATADGYRTVRRFISFDRDQELKIEMEELPARARARHRRALGPRVEQADQALPPEPASAQQPKSPRPEEPEPGAPLTTSPRGRAFDMRDPYAD